MDWTSVPHLLQALLIGMCMVMFVMGYRAGDKV